VGVRGPFLIGAAGQTSKAFLFENATDVNGAELMALLLQQTADVVDREVLFAGFNDLVTPGIGLGGTAWAFGRGQKERAEGVLSELMDQHAEAALGVAEAASGFLRRDGFDEEGPESFVLAMSRVGRLEEDLAGVCYLFVFSVIHMSTMSYGVVSSISKHNQLW
jgi:hypothetical protein